jgi:hypothetical protein
MIDWLTDCMIDNVDGVKICFWTAATRWYMSMGEPWWDTGRGKLLTRPPDLSDNLTSNIWEQVGGMGTSFTFTSDFYMS